MYLYLPNMILVLMRLRNPQVLSKSSVNSLKTVKIEFHVMKAICPEICTLICTNRNPPTQLKPTNANLRNQEQPKATLTNQPNLN